MINNKAQAVRLGFSLPIYNIILSARTWRGDH